MAASDYRLCDICEKTAFYDADIDDPHYLASFSPKEGEPSVGIAVLCSECNKTHVCVIIPRDVNYENWKKGLSND